MSGTEHFVCVTQNGFEPTFDDRATPASNSTSQASNTGSLVVGFGKVIPRWDAKSIPNRKLRYFINKNSFPDSATARRAELAFETAANRWNQVAFGLIFAKSNETEAHFQLFYSKNLKGYARAFFPNEGNDNKVMVSPLGLDLKRPQDGLKKTFIHELGHVLGLRHEHAIDRKERGFPLPFMGRNELSIMSYHPNRALQESDKDGIKMFYGVLNDYRINHVPIKDYKPVTKGTTAS